MGVSLIGEGILGKRNIMFKDKVGSVWSIRRMISILVCMYLVMGEDEV